MEFELMRYALGDLLNIKYGKNQKKVVDDNGQYPILGTGGVMGYANQFLYDRPSVLIGRKGSISKVRYIEEPFWTVDTLFYTEVNEKIVFPRYIYYVLSQIDFNYYNEGTTIPSLRTETLNQLEVLIPSKLNQKKILNALVPIDKKIKNNHEIINSLEQLAQTLFKRWFVDFEFPNEGGDPYKSSGGEMVESELGMIPAGWALTKLKEVTKHSKVAFNPQKEKIRDVAHFSLPAFDQQHFSYVENSSTIKSNKYYIDENSLLFSKMNPGTKRVWYPNINSNLSNVCSTEFVVLDTSIKKNKSLIYSVISSENFMNYLINNATGSTNSRQRVSPTTAIDFKFPYSEEVGQMFNSLITSFYDKALVNRIEIQSLANLRDTLLPKLLSGEIELSEETEVTEDVPIS